MHIPRSAEVILQGLSISDPLEIDLEAIAWLQGAKVKYRELDGCEACINGRADIGRAIISVDSRSYEKRQRFSLAHEIGHWEWHRGQQLMCSKKDIRGSGTARSGLSREAAANRFASELLMPKYIMKNVLRDFSRFTMKTVQEMADAFNVSKTAMAFRLVEIDFQPSLLVAYGREGRKWFVRSKSISEKWFPRDRLDSESSAYGILFNSEADDRSMSTFDADTWFDTDGTDGVELGEQSFRTSDDEVVSLLVAKNAGMIAD